MVSQTDVFMAADKVARAIGAFNGQKVIEHVRESEGADEGDLVEFAKVLDVYAAKRRGAVEDLFNVFLEEGAGFARKVADRATADFGKRAAKTDEAAALGILGGVFEEMFGFPLPFGARDEESAASRKLRYSTQSNNGQGRPKGYARYRPQKKTKVILAQVKEILRHYEAELPLTARQIFYRLVGAYGYPKTENAYENLTNYLVRARRARIIDFEDIRDDGASVMQEDHYSGEEAFYAEVRKMGERYERDKLATQKKDIRVYCEAAGMMPQLRRVTRRYSVPVYSCSGFDSLTAKYDLAEDVRDAFTYRGRPTVILHLGDHDPSGETIFDVISEDVYAFLEVDVPHKAPDSVAIFERVALTSEQIVRYDLPTDPAKESSHSAGWGARRACQLEALEPDVLAGLLINAIEEHLDLDALKADREAEAEERRKIAKALPAPSSED
jgi:hypothetical protein